MASEVPKKRLTVEISFRFNLLKVNGLSPAQLLVDGGTVRAMINYISDRPDLDSYIAFTRLARQPGG
jgi:hypothetical protein